MNSAPQFYLPISYRVGRQLRPTDSPARALRSLRRRQQGDSAWLAGCRNPRTGIGAGCARAASGHPTVLPITLMKSRRRIPSPASGPGHIRFSIRPSEHEISTGKIGARWSILHSSNSEPDMSLVGQKPALPRRSIGVRFALNKQTLTERVQYDAMVKSRMGAVAWAMRQRSVSHPRSSNRTCGFPASGSPTGFTVRHTKQSTDRKRHLRGVLSFFASRHSFL